MRTPIEDLKNELHILEELSKQKHPDFLKYKNSIPVYEKAIKTLTEAETCDPELCDKLEGLSVFYDPCKECNLDKPPDL